jgi:protein CpxP
LVLLASAGSSGFSLSGWIFPEWKEYSTMNAKSRLLIVERTLLMAAILAVSCAALCAQSGEVRRHGGNQERELQQLTQMLSLSGDQQTQVKSLLAERREKMEALRSGAAGSDASTQAAQPGRPQMEAIRRDTNAKIAALLNDDQKTKFAAWQEQRRQEMEQRRGGGGETAPASQPPST